MAELDNLLQEKGVAFVAQVQLLLAQALQNRPTNDQLVAAVEAVVGLAPEEMDTLHEIAVVLKGSTDNYAAMVPILAGKLSSETFAQFVAAYVMRNTWTVKSEAYTAVDGDKLVANTAVAAFSITLPQTPGEVQVRDVGATWATKNLTIVVPAGATLYGVADGLLVCDVNSAHLRFVRPAGSTTWTVSLEQGISQ